MSDSARLRWQCRRGMRELDELLLRYLNARYPEAPEEEKSTFQAVLALSDPELNAYLLQRQTPPTEPIELVIQHILSLPHA